MKLSNESFELYGLHVFGFVVHLIPDAEGQTYSQHWGASPAYEEMLKTYKPAMNQELHTWESRLTLTQLSMNEEERFPEFIIAPKDMLSRDDARSVFNNQMRLDIARILFYRDSVPAKEACETKIQWRNWPKQAVLHSLRIINWPSDIPLPTEKGTDSTRAISKEDMQAHLVLRNAAFPNFIIEGDSSNIKYPAVVSWTALERNISPADKEAWGKIPVLVDDLGETRLDAAAGKTQLANKRSRHGGQLEQRMRALMKENEDDGDEDEGDANHDRGLDTRRPKSKGKKRSSNTADDSDVSVGPRR
ncbi:hypothetical protein H0H92_012740, partial [Tricholoma furcatifolium]